MALNLDIAGDYGGVGTRRSELWHSCKRLGMRQENITMLKFDELRDHPTVEWSVDLLTRIVENHVISHSIDTVIFSLFTFWKCVSNCNSKKSANLLVSLGDYI